LRGQLSELISSDGEANSGGRVRDTFPSIGGDKNRPRDFSGGRTNIPHGDGVIVIVVSCPIVFVYAVEWSRERRGKGEELALGGRKLLEEKKGIVLHTRGTFQLGKCRYLDLPTL
jgi:hypothetical protein